MARNTQLLQLVDQLRSELGISLNPSQGINTLATHKYKLKVAQEFLYLDYAWPFLNGNSFDVPMQAGERYYDLPVSNEGIKRVEMLWGNSWTPLRKGIGGPNYTSQNPDNQRSDPPQAWDFYGLKQFEVWPVPASAVATVRFYGTQALPLLVADNSRALLDDRLIVLYAAWSLSTKEQKANRLADFNSHYRALKKRNTSRSRGFVLGQRQNAPQGRLPPGPVRVAEANRS